MINFDEENYKSFCENNGLVPCRMTSLSKFESLCQRLGIETRPKKSLGVAK